MVGTFDLFTGVVLMASAFPAGALGAYLLLRGHCQRFCRGDWRAAAFPCAILGYAASLALLLLWVLAVPEKPSFWAELDLYAGLLAFFLCCFCALGVGLLAYVAVSEYGRRLRRSPYRSP